MNYKPKGTTQTVDLAGLQFIITHRTLGDDGGPTIEVYGNVAGQRIQVLRFDCFHKQPHYHMPPSSDKIYHLNPTIVGNGLDWTLTQIREQIPQMLSKAGFSDLASQVEQDTLRSEWTTIQKAVETSAGSAT